MSTFNAKQFAQWLKEKYLDSRFKSWSELADAAGLKRSTVSSLATAKEQTSTGKPSQPRADTVERLARALGVDPDEALLQAGHAPRAGMIKAKPKTFAEFIAALEQLGIEIPGWDAHLDYENEDFEELKNRIALDAGMVIKRKKK